MNPDAARHAAIIFLAVFGGLGMWFAGFIWLSRRQGAPPPVQNANWATYWAITRYNITGRVQMLAVTVPTVILVGLLFMYW
jgi:hypothetical protein